jgi:predicted transcriptional regulator
MMTNACPMLPARHSSAQVSSVIMMTGIRKLEIRRIAPHTKWYHISRSRNELTDMSEIKPNEHVLGLTAQIVSAHVSHNVVTPDTLPALIQSVYRILTKAKIAAAEPEKPQPAVPAKRSVFPDYIICLEDERKLKMLKRYLQTAYNMTPAQYRERWGLSSDYPMVEPNYADVRSSLAKKIGLGRKPAEARASAKPRRHVA